MSDVSLGEAFRLWLKIGLLSFGGPAAQIALMHKMLVEEKHWLNEKQFLNALSFCMLLPGPEAMQLATYAGWRLHGWQGGLVAGLLFVLPGALVILALALIYELYGDVPEINAIFIGIKATVLVIVLEALLRLARKALDNRLHWLTAIAAFIGIFFFSLPFPLIVLAAGLVGFVFIKNVSIEQSIAAPGVSGMLSTVLLWAAIWSLPFIIVLAFNADSILLEIGSYFSRLAVVTFGGAYAVLAYMGQSVVEQFGWLSTGEMMDGLGLAETTPGPLILVTEFVGFLAAYREGGLGLGLLGALMTLWVTFVPCFLWIFAGAPHIDWICSQPRLKNALTSIAAAVVGVILNLTIWFSLHVLFSEVELKQWGLLTLWNPDPGSLDPVVLVLTLLCGFLILVRRWSVIHVLVTAACLGWLSTLLNW